MMISSSSVERERESEGERERERERREALRTIDFDRRGGDDAGEQDRGSIDRSTGSADRETKKMRLGGTTPD